VRSFAVTIGAPGVETPTGRFAVTDSFRGELDPAAYGCCALALSATQPHLPSGWLGGNRIAIHGTSGPLGVAASHGCVRAADEDVSALVARVPLGTPVFIRS
jgi:lipoprotein-anchoring transpeptidase ErfK/SrfK